MPTTAAGKETCITRWRPGFCQVMELLFTQRNVQCTTSSDRKRNVDGCEPGDSETVLQRDFYRVRMLNDSVNLLVYVGMPRSDYGDARIERRYADGVVVPCMAPLAPGSYFVVRTGTPSAEGQAVRNGEGYADLYVKAVPNYIVLNITLEVVESDVVRR